MLSAWKNIIVQESKDLITAAGKVLGSTKSKEKVRESPVEDEELCWAISNFHPPSYAILMRFCPLLVRSQPVGILVQL